MNMAASDFQAGQQPIRVLRYIHDETNRTMVLRKAIAELEPDAVLPRETRLKRVHMRSDGGFVVETTCIATSGEDRTCFIEIPAGEFADRAVEITRRSEKQHQRLGTQPLSCLPCYSDVENGLFVRMWGTDEMIDGLAALYKPQMLGDQLPDNAPLARVALIAHRLNRRAVLSICLHGGEEQMVKLYKKGSSKPKAALAITSLLERTSFGKHSPISVPHGASPLRSWSGYVMDRAPGVQLAKLLGDARHSGMALAGAALGRLHRLPLRLQQSHAVSDEVRLLQSWTHLVSSVFPTQAKTLRSTLQDVSKALLATGEPVTTLVHRDFHEGQVLVSGEQGTLIDFDTVCNGESAQDIGNFLGHLDLANVESGNSQDRAADVFLSAYAETCRLPDAARVNAHRRATQLRLACIYAFSDSHHALWPELLERASGGRS